MDRLQRLCPAERIRLFRHDYLFGFSQGGWYRVLARLLSATPKYLGQLQALFFVPFALEC